MPLAIHTNEVMRALPEALRPNPWNLDDSVIEMIGNGWTSNEIAQAIIADKPREPGHVVSTIRRMKNWPSATTRRNTANKWSPHAKCPDPSHDRTCELCYCIPGEVTHHVRSTQ